MPDTTPRADHHLMPAMHRLTEADFDALADSAGTVAGIKLLCIAERSKHILLLHQVLVNAAVNYPTAYTELRLHTAFQLLVRAQECEPDVVAKILSLPGVGAWAAECLLRLDMPDSEEPAVWADLAQINAIAATAGLLAGLDFMLPVPLREGQLILPGLGPLNTSLKSEYVLMRHSAAGTALLDDGLKFRLPSPLPPRTQLIVRHGGRVLGVHLDVSDPFLAGYLHHPLAYLDQAAAADWTDRLAGAWRILTDYHAADATAIATLLNTIVPLTTDFATRNVSATSAAAFGAIAASLPPDDMTLAETLIHECQHLKLCALLDLFPMLKNDCEGLYYAPWRDDPRPISGLLQGACAYFGVTRFWRQQRNYGSPHQALRGNVEFARRRAETLAVTHALLHSGELTGVGARFVRRMRTRLLDWRNDAVPTDARRMAAEVSTDHAAMWRLRHLACDPKLADGLVKSWQAGARLDDTVFSGDGLPDAILRVTPGGIDTNQARSFLLALRYTHPERFRAVLSGESASTPIDSLGLSQGDLALLRGDHAAAIAAYRAEIRHHDNSIAPWAGLITATRAMNEGHIWKTLLMWAPLVFAVHSRVGNADPLELAVWLAEGHSPSAEPLCQ